MMVTLILTIVGISDGMLAEAAGRVRGTGADILVKGPGAAIIASGSAASLPEGIVQHFETEYPGVKAVAPALLHGVGGFASITGVDFARFEKVSGGLRVLEGRMVRNRNEVLIDPYYARQNKKKPGDKLHLVNTDFTVAGIMEGGKLSQVLVDLSYLQELTSNKGRISQVMVKLNDPAKTEQVIAMMRDKLPGYFVMSIEQFASAFSVQNVPGLKPFISVIIGIALVVGFLTVSLTMYTAVLERTREIGILKALGATPVFIMSMLMRESFFLAILGTVVGILLSYGSKFAIETFVPASIKQQIVFEWWPVALGVAIAGALLGTLYPGVKALRHDAIEALSYE